MNSPTELVAAGGSNETWGPLLEVATREVFHLMLNCDLAPPTADLTAPQGVSAMVGMAGKLCGVLTVYCDEKSAALMTSKMLGTDPDKVGAGEISDALGEICNMVAGNFKNKISGLGDSCMLSPPTVVSGSDYSMYSLADSPALEIKLLFENMPVFISLQIHT